MRLVAFDLETTGLDTAKDRIVEFCFVELDENLAEVGRLSRLVNPGVPIPEESSAIHGITDDQVRGEPPFAEWAARVQGLVQEAVLLAHNHRFDVALLHHELVRAGQEGLRPDHPAIDTLLIEQLVNSHGLEATYRRYTGRELPQAHRAQDDVEATVEVLRRQRQQHADRLPPALEDLVNSRLAAAEGRGGKVWLDHARKLYRDEQGTVRFNFGKHRDESTAQHQDYLRWMLGKDFPDDTLRAVRECLQSM